MTPFQIALELNPFTDSGGDTYIQVEITGLSEIEQIPLDTEIGRDIIRAMLAEHRDRGAPTDHEVRGLARMIKGLAYKRERRESVSAAKHLIALNPLARAVVAIAKEGGTRADLPRLLAKLHHVVEREDIEITNKPLPRNVDSLGRQLSGIQCILSAVNVPIVRNDKDRPRTWTIPPVTTSDQPDANVTSESNDESKSSVSSDTSIANVEGQTQPEAINGDNEIDTLLQEVVA